MFTSRKLREGDQIWSEGILHRIYFRADKRRGSTAEIVPGSCKEQDRCEVFLVEVKSRQRNRCSDDRCREESVARMGKASQYQSSDQRDFPGGRYRPQRDEHDLSGMILRASPIEAALTDSLPAFSVCSSRIHPRTSCPQSTSFPITCHPLTSHLSLA